MKQIIPLFPVPIYFSQLTRKINKTEKAFVEKQKNKLRNNEGNYSSLDNYILNNKPFSQLKKDLTLRVNDYFKKIIEPKYKIKPYITQSWLNFTSLNEYHHAHAHPNSVISGVFYFKTKLNEDKIFFENNTYNQIYLEPKGFNGFNSSSWWFPINDGELILFPSSTRHYVQMKSTNNLRISLAFNVFVKGKLGKNETLTELILK